MSDLSKGLKKAIDESTNKLGKINAQYNTDMEIAEGMEAIFGKVKFKNTTELNKIAQKLEGLFSQKGLSPQVVDDFLKRLKINPEKFRASEAVRGVYDKATGANTKGLSIAEIVQQVTSAVVTPKMVKNIAIATGLSSSIIDKIIKTTAPAARGSLIKSLMGLTE
jgi:hypothetical protein